MTETTNSRQFKGRIALISPPWPIFSRPSIQLGSLKAYLQAHHPGLAISCHHVYLQMAAAVGYPVYRQLAKEAWLAESIYAALLYPEQQRPARQLFYRQARPYPDLRRLVFEDLVSCVRKTTEEFIDLTDWRALDLAGLSVCLCQLTASLYFIKKIRQKAPELPIILGGSQVGGQTAEDLLKTFAEIDLIVAGEGELPLSRLISHLQTGGGWNDLPDFPGRVRRGANASAAFSFSQLPDLGPLPAPDYSDYFTMLATFSPDKKFFPTLPVEMSRGCWWRSGTADRPGGCAFCNLNVQWHGYRSKEPAQVTEEIERLTGKHRVLSTAFMDNALPPKKSRELFQMLAESGQDVQCFSELRATTERRTLEDYRKGGMTEVQIGIEALSDGLLKKLNKGTTVMDNLAVMKNCEALGLRTWPI